VKQAQFLIRFDDICPTMNWTMWASIEAILCESGVRPIVAIVPDNRDPALRVEPACDSFWELVRGWQGNEWGIALHGYQHLYVTKDGGILRLNQRSEFAGLPKEEQARKLVSGMEVFRNERVHPSIWVAPSHSFDWVTVGLLRELGIRVISDGLFPYPHTDATRTLWIPQQLWRFRDVPCGVWTVCYHHNDWTETQLNRFRLDVERFRHQIVSPSEVTEQYAGRRQGISDRMAALAMLGFIRGMACYGRLQSLATNGR
jgi:predicted deacetylase